MTRSNFAWSCPFCNHAKGDKVSGKAGRRAYPLFNPRTQQWNRHFEWDHTILIGKTNIGIVTINVLDINAEKRVQFREWLFFEGRFPPLG